MCPASAPSPSSSFSAADRLAVAEEFAALVWRAGRWIRSASTSSQELSASQTALLAHLAAEGPQAGADLARWEGVTPQAVASTLAALHEQGFADRIESPADERRRPSVITAEGRAVLDRVSRRRAEAVHEGLLADLTDDELAALATGVQAVRAAYERHRAAGRA